VQNDGKTKIMVDCHQLGYPENFLSAKYKQSSRRTTP